MINIIAMKQIILILGFLVLGSFSVIKAQDSLKKQPKKAYLGLELAYANPTLFKDGFFPCLTFSKGKHTVFAGAFLIYYDAWHPRPLWGAQAGYRIFPNGAANRFNLFFDYMFNLLNGKITDKVSSGYYYPQDYGTQTTHFVHLDNYLGFGVRWNVVKHFYASLGVGSSIGFSKEEYSYDYSNGKKYQSTGKLMPRLFRPDNNIIKFGLGYQLPVSGKK